MSTKSAYRLPMRKTVAVVGLGNIGAALAASLAVAGRHDLIACARRPIPRLTLDGPQGVIDTELSTITDPGKARRADWVMLCCKAQDTPSTAPWLAALCGPDTIVAVLQNGVDHVRRVEPYANGATILPAIVYYNGERVGDDRVRLRQVSEHDLLVEAGPAGEALAELLAGTPINVGRSPEFGLRAWRKLLLNIVVNPITALTLQRQQVLRRDDVHALSLELLHEAIAVGQAEGVPLTEADAAGVMATLFSYSGELGTSMYFDRLAGRKLEIDALTGAVVAAAERNGLAVPLNRAMLALLRAVSDAA